MILVDEFVKLNVSAEFLSVFLVVIQLGAIMAVIILYFHKLNPFAPSKSPAQKRNTWAIWGRVLVATIPAGIIGALFDDWVDEHFYNYMVVAVALIFYGIVFIVMERRNRKRIAAAQAQNTTMIGAEEGRHSKRYIARVQARSTAGDADAQAEAADDRDATERDASSAISSINDFGDMSLKTALGIGLFQCLAIIPGTSRSGTTIIGSMLLGASRTVATEFSFFLAIPIMFGWSLVRLLRHGLAFTSTELAILGVGCATAFAVSIVAIKFLIRYIKRNDFTGFGWYRIVLGVVVIAAFAVFGLA